MHRSKLMTQFNTLMQRFATAEQSKYKSNASKLCWAAATCWFRVLTLSSWVSPPKTKSCCADFFLRRVSRSTLLHKWVHILSLLRFLFQFSFHFFTFSILRLCNGNHYGCFLSQSTKRALIDVSRLMWIWMYKCPWICMYVWLPCELNLLSGNVKMFACVGHRVADSWVQVHTSKVGRIKSMLSDFKIWCISIPGKK